MESFRYRCFNRAWAVSALVHLTLPDALQWSWLVPDLLLGAGALGLLARPGTPRSRLTMVFFALAVVGLAWPLVWLGDQLTQSGYLLLGALAGLLFRRGDGLMLAIRLLTIGVYAVALFHKLNADFLDPSVSCATGGMELLAANWSLPLAPRFMAPVWPPLFWVAEASVVLLFVAAPRFAVGLALVMHIPLTIVFAPSFAWVMASGWVAFFRPEELQHLMATSRERWKRIVGVGGLLGGLSAALYFRDHWVPYPLWQLKELGLWMALVAYAVAQSGWPKGPSAWRQRPRAPLAWGLFALFLLNAATPYMGIQFHHAGAMLSNLRVDSGCWNHLLVPEAVRLADPYVRVSEVYVGGQVDGARALEAQMRERLWHPADLRASVTRYCAAGVAPLALAFDYEGDAYDLTDACEGLPLPSQRPGSFQTNLLRECPQRCVH